MLYIYRIINNPIKTNMRIHGNKINNQEISECPSLQIRLSTHVQNKTYTISTTKTIVVLGTFREKEPTL
jgi:hypothetical protein